MEHHFDFKRFELKSNVRNTFLGVSALGLIMVFIGLAVNPHQPGRFWANFLLSSFYFSAFAVLAVAFMGIQYLASGGWSIAVKRIFEAISMYLPVGLVAFLILLIATFFGDNSGMHAIYEWTHKDVVAHDEVLTGKSGYLNVPFWAIRMIIFFGSWTLFARAYRKYSLNEDEVGGMLNYNRSFRLSAFFLPFFGLSFCLAAFDWLMSIQPHWYSTIFAVNVFAGSLVGMLTITNLTIIFMKRNGYMDWVNESHMHDISKFQFGFSIFWTYTWLAQYLLIWYANMPEETAYYYLRLHGGWTTVFFANLILNFACPFLLFMMRESKRKFNSVLFVSILLLIGRFVDWYLIIMPMSAKHDSGFGFYEVGFWLLFAGIFAYVIAASLAKASLVPKNDPYLVESLHHDI